MTRDVEALACLVHLDVAAAGDAAGAHAARNNGGVARHAAAHREDALSGVHALDVFRRSLKANQHDLAVFRGFDGGFGGEVNGTGGGTRRSRQTLGNGLRGLEGGFVKLRVEQRVKLLRLDLEQRFVGRDHAFFDEVDGDLQRGGGGALAVTRLQHIELTVFDGKLHVLHIVIMLFKVVRDGDELLVHLGHNVLELVNCLRRTNAGDDVFALRVHQELAVELALTGRGVAGKRNAGARRFAHVAEHHALHVDGGAPRAGDVVHAAVVVGTGIVPAAENGLDGAHQLLTRVGGEVFAQLSLILGLKLARKLLQVVGRQLGVEVNALFFLHLVDELFKIFLADFHDDIGVHLDKTAIAVVSEAGVLRLGGKCLDDLVVQAEVQNGVHHAGHRGARARTHGDEQGVVQVTELLAGDFFELRDILVDLRFDVCADALAVVVVLRAGFRADGEALGNGHAKLGHLGEVRALSAEQVFHAAVRLRKEVNILMHLITLRFSNS